MSSEPINRFKEWVEKTIQNKGGGFRLPTQSQLSEQFGISISTVKAILAKEVQAKRLCTLTRGGTFVEPYNPIDPNLNIDVKPSSVELLTNQLTALINEGKLRRGQALPLVKQIAIKYSISKDTVIKTFAILKERGYLTKIGKQYWVGGVNFNETTNLSQSVYLFYQNTETSFFKTPIVLMEIEKELNNCNTKLVFKPLTDLDTCIKKWIRSKVPPIGLLFPDFDQKLYDPVYEKLKDFAINLKKFSPSVVFITKRLERLYQKFNYLTPGSIHTQMGKKFAQLCFDQSIHEFKIFYEDDKTKIYNFRDSVRFITEVGIKNPHVKLGIHYYTDNQYDFEKRLTQTLVFEGSWQKFLDRTFGKYQKDGLNMNNKDIFISEKKILDSFVKPNKKAVWFFTQDWLATKAIHWAKRNDIKMGKELLIFSLENSLEYISESISTITPDWSRIAYMLSHALLKDLKLQKSSQGYIRPSISILHRLTS